MLFILKSALFLLSLFMILRPIQAAVAVAKTGLAKEVTLRNAAIKFVIGVVICMITKPF